jgi:hypothetical protein
MPDQQAGGARMPDQWYAEEEPTAEERPRPAPHTGEGRDETEETRGTAEAGERGAAHEAEPAGAEEEHKLPDADEAGTGPRGARQPEGVRPDQPPPDEPTD